MKRLSACAEQKVCHRSSWPIKSKSPDRLFQNGRRLNLSLTLYPELSNQKIRVLFSPSVANESFSFHVQKVDSFGQSSTYPAIYSQGTCVSDVLIDPSYDDFTLYAVINDGTYEHTTGLIQIYGMSASGYNFEELWN